MKSMMKLLAVGAALAATSMALAQDTTTTNTDLLGSLSNLLLGGGVVGLLVVGALIFFLFRWFGGD